MHIKITKGNNAIIEINILFSYNEKTLVFLILL